MKTSIKEIDEVIHKERIDSDKKKVTHQRMASDITDGTFVIVNDDPWLVNKGRLHRWTPFGYEDSTAIPQPTSVLMVLTPNSIVNAFRAGYVPQMKSVPGLRLS